MQPTTPSGWRRIIWNSLLAVLVTSPLILSIVSAKNWKVRAEPGTSEFSMSETGLPIFSTSSRANCKALALMSPGEAVQHVHPITRRHARPHTAAKSLTCGLYRGVDIIGIAPCHLAKALAGCRVDAFEFPAGFGADEFAIDEIAGFVFQLVGIFVKIPLLQALGLFEVHGGCPSSMN